jgi:hypothetical protein
MHVEEKGRTMDAEGSQMQDERYFFSARSSSQLVHQRPGIVHLIYCGSREWKVNEKLLTSFRYGTTEVRQF